MSARASSVLIASAILFISSCSRQPSTDEIAAPDEGIIELVRAHELPIQNDGIAAHRAALDATLREVERRYGRHSSAYVQARSEAAIVVYAAAGAAASIEYFREWLRASEAVYGHEHRETAFALNDYGRIQALAGGYDPATLIWLRDAMQVRRRVLGLEHMETAASEGFVAQELLASCDLAAPCRPDDVRLTEAEELAIHAVQVYRDEFPTEHGEMKQMRSLLGRIRARQGKSSDRNEGVR